MDRSGHYGKPKFFPFFLPSILEHAAAGVFRDFISGTPQRSGRLSSRNAEMLEGWNQTNTRDSFLLISF